MCDNMLSTKGKLDSAFCNQYIYCSGIRLRSSYQIQLFVLYLCQAQRTHVFDCKIQTTLQELTLVKYSLSSMPLFNYLLLYKSCCSFSVYIEDQRNFTAEINFWCQFFLRPSEYLKVCFQQFSLIARVFFRLVLLQLHMLRLKRQIQSPVKEF